MNNEEIKEAIETLERNYPFDRYVQLKKAVDVAIEALHTVNSPILTMKRLGEFQADAIMQSGKDTDVPDDDSISRQDAIDMVYGCEDEFGKDVVFRIADYIRQLPSAEPEVIHCKDCKYMRRDVIFDQCWCEHPRKTKEVTDTYFCGFGYAERKDDGNR